MSYYDKAKDLFKMVFEGKVNGAVEKYYHNDVIILTDDNKVRKGKEKALNYNINLLTEIEDVNGSELITITSDEERAITMVEFMIDVKFKNGNKRKFEEVSIQYWDDNLIVKENFYSKK